MSHARITKTMVIQKRDANGVLQVETTTVINENPTKEELAEATRLPGMPDINKLFDGFLENMWRNSVFHNSTE